MYHTVIYEKLSYNQRNNIINFIKKNFKNIPYDGFGIEPKTIIILNYEDNNIIGCLCLLNNRILKNILLNAKVNLEQYNFQYGNGLYLYNLCVDENFRCKNIGSELVEEALIMSKNIGIDYIHVQAESEISRNLFLKKGFIENNDFISFNNTVYVMLKFI
jgi:ribosomal protein S18 acetylase RimI-like enzyme